MVSTENKNESMALAEAEKIFISNREKIKKERKNIFSVSERYIYSVFVSNFGCKIAKDARETIFLLVLTDSKDFVFYFSKENLASYQRADELFKKIENYFKD